MNKVLRYEIESLIQGLDGTAGVYIRDDEKSFEFTFNPDVIFPAASLIKLPIYWDYLTRVFNGELNPNVSIRPAAEDKVGGCGILKHAPPNTEYSLDNLAELMITVSDNTATNVLIDILSLDRVNASIKEFGFNRTILQRKMMDYQSLADGKDNITTPQDIFYLFKELLHPKKKNPDISSQMINTMKKQQLNNKLPALLPRRVVMAHKTGEIVGAEHDAGIMFVGDERCIIVVMTKNLIRNEDGISFCRKIGKIVYSVTS